MSDTYDEIHDLAEKNNSNMRDACYYYSLKRIETVYDKRGIN